MSFWTKHLQDGNPEPVLRADGAAYRQMRRQVSASAIYADPGQTPEQRRAASLALTASRYAPGYAGLESYDRTARTSKWALGNESDAAYIARTDAVIRHLDQLPDGDQKLILEARQSISEREVTDQAAWDTHRAVVEAHTAGMGGTQQMGNRVQADQRFGHARELAHDGGQGAGSIVTPATMTSAAVAQVIRAREQAPQHQDISALRSSGEGWLTR